MSIEKIVLPTQGLLGYTDTVKVQAMKGRHLSTLLSSLDSGAIDKVLEELVEPQIPMELLTDEDKTYILHKIRELTFGSEIKQTIKCPVCGETHEYTLDYQDFNTINLKQEDVERVFEFKHNDINFVVTNQVPTQRTWDEVEQYKRRHNPSNDMSYIMMQAAHINKINGRQATMAEKIRFLADEIPAKTLIQIAEHFKVVYGFDPTFVVECEKCGTAFTGGLAFTANLFR